MTLSAIGQLDARQYLRHPLHQSERTWPETNCYADLWIEVLHALKLEPEAMLPFTLAVDFEGDQWTFFKPSLSELHQLYGIDVQELTLWRPLEDHLVEQLGRGRLVLAEVDAFHLPDTSGTDYRTQHTKTTIGVESIDPASGRLGYFHNAGYFELGEADYRLLFPRESAAPGVLPPYVEFAKLSSLRRLDPGQLMKRSRALLSEHLGRAPRENPMPAFSARFSKDLEQLKSGQLPSYHTYAFASLRQLGAAFDLGARYLLWLEGHGEQGLQPVAAELDQLSATAKAMILKTARAVTTGRAVDFAPLMQTLERCWANAMGTLQARYGG